MLLNKILSRQTLPELCQLVAVDNMNGMNFRKASLSAENSEEFLQTYRHYVDLGEAHLAEMPGPVVPILVDVDLKLQPCGTQPKNLYGEEDVCAVAVAYARTLKELFVMKAGTAVIEFAVLTKEPRIENEACKHGFHLHSLNVAIQAAFGSTVYRRAKQHLAGQSTTASVDAVFSLDEALDDVSGKPWLLYGSTKKAGKKPFIMTARLTVCLDSLQTTYTPCCPPDVIEGLRLLSIRIPPSPTVQDGLVVEAKSAATAGFGGTACLPAGRVDKTAMKYIWNKAQQQQLCLDEDCRVEDDGADLYNMNDDDDVCIGDTGREFVTCDGEDDPDVVEAVRYVLMEMLKRSRSDSRSDWIRVCMALANTCVVGRSLKRETAYQLFQEFSQLSDKYDETVCKTTWTQVVDREQDRTAKGESINTLTFRKVIFMARSDYQEALELGVATERRFSISQLIKIICGRVDTFGVPLSVSKTASRYESDNLSIAGPSLDDLAKDLETVAYPRTKEPVKVMKFLYGVIAQRRFKNPDMLEFLMEGLACECYIGRFSEVEGLDLFIDIFGGRAPHLFTDRESANILWSATLTKAKDSIIKSTTKPHTIGIVCGFALVDAPTHTRLIERISAQVPRKVMDVYVAQALRSWWSHSMCFYDKKWYEFVGHYWRKRHDMESVMRKYIVLWFLEMQQQRIAATLSDEYNDIEDLHKSGADTPLLEAIERMTHNISSQNRLVTALESFHSVVNPGIKAFSFNARKNLIGMQNCVFDSDTRKLRPGREDDYIAHVLNFSFIEEADLDTDTVEFVEDFLKKILPNNEKREYFLNSISHIFSGGNPWKQYIICTGEGHNGKSVLFKWFEELLGPLVQKLNKGVILYNMKRDTLGPSPDVVKLATSRLAITDEIALGDTLNSGTIKLFSGNDTFTCRDLYAKSEDMITIDPVFLPVIVCNRLPSLHRPDMAAWCRLRVFKFESRFVANVAETLKEIREGTLPNVNPNYVYPRNEKMASLLCQQTVLNVFGSMLLHRYIKLCDAEDRGLVMDSPPLCVLEAQTLFRVSQNPVKIAVAKKYEFRSPFEETVVDVDGLTEEERFLHEEFEAKKSEEYSDSVSLREIIALVETSTGGRARFDVADIKEATKQFALAYKPFVTWHDGTLSGLRLAA